MKIFHNEEIVFLLSGVAGILLLIKTCFHFTVVDDSTVQTLSEVQANEIADNLFHPQIRADILQALINEPRPRNARNLLLSVEKHLKRLVHGTPRHDDMTMVICKVGETDERNQ